MPFNIWWNTLLEPERTIWRWTMKWKISTWANSRGTEGVKNGERCRGGADGSKLRSHNRSSSPTNGASELLGWVGTFCNFPSLKPCCSQENIQSHRKHPEPLSNKLQSPKLLRTQFTISFELLFVWNTKKRTASRLILIKVKTPETESYCSGYFTRLGQNWITSDLNWVVERMKLRFSAW